MRKQAIALIAVISIVLLYGCNGINESKQVVEDEYNYITDSQMTMMGSDPYLIDVAKGEEGYYSYKNKLIYYTDSKTFESTPLCFKPNCMHSTTDCNAYIGSTYSIAYNDGYIYYNQSGDVEHELLGVQFYRMKADGSEKEILWYFDYMVMEWTVHRGYLYYVYAIYGSDSSSILGSDNSDAYVYRQKLSDSKLNPEEVYFAEEVKKNSSITCPVGIGNNLYFNVNGFSRDDSDVRINNYMKVDLSTFKAQCMKLKDGRIMVYPTLLGNDLIFQTAKKADGNIDYYKTNFNGENPEFFMEVLENERLFTDGTFVYVNNEFDINMGYDDTLKFTVYTSKFDEVEEVSFDLSEYSGKRFLCLDDQVFLFIEETPLGGTMISVLDKSQLGSVDGVWERKICYNTDENTKITNSPGALSDSAPHGSDTLVDLWQKAKDKEYGVKDSFQAEGAEAEGGFSVRLMWEQDGGTFTAYFPFMEFENEDKAKGYINTNPYALQKENIVVNIGVESVPQEVYDMLFSILDGAPVTPIDSKDFSGENFTFK